MGVDTFSLFKMTSQRRSGPYFLKQKSEALKYFKIFKAEAENQAGKHNKVLRSDNGRECNSTEFKDFLQEHGIREELTAAYSPQQIGGAERLNRTLVEMA